jgi:hypothetical protein
MSTIVTKEAFEQLMYEVRGAPLNLPEALVLRHMTLAECLMKYAFSERAIELIKKRYEMSDDDAKELREQIDRATSSWLHPTNSDAYVRMLEAWLAQHYIAKVAASFSAPKIR